MKALGLLMKNESRFIRVDKIDLNIIYRLEWRGITNG